MTRALTTNERLLKLATGRALKGVGGQVEAERLTGRCQSTLSGAASLNPGRYQFTFVTVAEAVILDQAAEGGPYILPEMARQNGYALVALPAPVTGGDVMAHFGCVAKESGEVLSKVGVALKDGRLTAKEIRSGKLELEIDQAIQALVDLKAALAALSHQRLEAG